MRRECIGVEQRYTGVVQKMHRCRTEKTPAQRAEDRLP
ncbi:hypothetical protein HMPREF1508_1915 [Shuttleworthella sp. MSX8B]|nr:hypothetical protein HMPREF1508_1915 [Shuttleworthia sp. MSX8B]